MSSVFFDIFQYGTSHNYTPFGPKNAITSSTSFVGYGVAGLLVGFGTKLANGCTSGHGLCGLPRLSMRSIVSVMIFLSCGLASSTIGYYFTLGALSDDSSNPDFNYQHIISSNICLGIGIIVPFIVTIFRVWNRTDKQSIKEIIIDQTILFLTGIIFGAGLLVAGMVRRSNILGFLKIGADWNPSLLFVLGCGVIVNLFTFTYMLKSQYFIINLEKNLFQDKNYLILTTN